jgi:GNAT superfamily N-acetyltransferase
MMDANAPFTLRLARADDESFLFTMLFYAAHADEEPGATVAQIAANPSLARYAAGYGRPGDLGVIAEGTRGPMGAAWVRLLAGEERAYGWVDDATPELVISVLPDGVARGLGSALLHELLDHARGRYPAVSLSVRKTNPARRLYLRFGFSPVREVVNRVGGVSETMVLKLA